MVGMPALTAPSGACRLNGQWMPLACTQKPTKANMATRPCLISAWRNQPMVSGEDSPMLSGSQKPTVGLSFFASVSRPALSEISPDVHGFESKLTSSEKPILADTRLTGATVGAYERAATELTASIVCEA